MNIEIVKQSCFDMLHLVCYAKCLNDERYIIIELILQTFEY